MLSLTRFARIARQYGVDFEVQFTANASYIWVGGKTQEWKGSHFYNALLQAGARFNNKDSGMRMYLESLT